ncbi:YkgJ family cysteine cluster protein [Nanoarchaeota archaeon]
MLEYRTPKNKKVFLDSRLVYSGVLRELELGQGSIEDELYNAAQILAGGYSVLDDEIKTLMFNLEGHSITCSKGCDYCCHEPLTGTFFEGVLLAEWLDQHPEVKEKFQDRYSDWIAEGTLETFADYHAQACAGVNIELPLGIFPPCPLLEDDVCAAYPVRPIICRTFMSMSNPLKCRDRETVRQLTTNDFLSFMYRHTQVVSFLEDAFELPRGKVFVVQQVAHELLKDRSGYLRAVRRMN